MRKKLFSLLMAAAMLLSALPAAAASEGEPQKLPTPEVEWLTEGREIDGRQFRAGQAVMTNVPTDILLNYRVEILNAAGEVVEKYEDGFGGTPRSVQEIWVGWYMDEGYLPSGNYYIQVTYLGNDSQTYTDSEPGVSKPYTYTYPNTAYAVPTDIRWDGANFGYTLPQEALVEDTVLFLDFVRTDGENAGRGGRRAESTRNLQETDNAAFLERFNERLTLYGEGKYKFRIRVISQDITQKWHSEWSEWSEERYVSAEGLSGDGSLANDLDQIIAGLENGGETIDRETKTEAVEAVQKLDQTELQQAMSADQDGTGVTQQLKELEDKLNIGAEVTVDNALGISAADVSVIGAGFSTSNVNTAPTFTISKPSEEKELSATYRSVMQLELSLGETVQTNEDGTLLVPIQITIPVPSWTNTDYLYILHFRQDGTYERIHPDIVGEAGAPLARFTVNRLSPFVFAEFHPYTVTFDLNGGEGTAPAPQQTDENGRLKSLPADPTRAGHTFTGWFTAKENGQKVDTSYQFTADATVYAVWQATGGGNTGGNTGGSTGGGSTGGTTVRPSVPEAVTEGETTTVTTGLNASLSGGTARAEVRRAVLDETVDQLLEAAAEAGTAPVAAFDLDTPAGTEGVRLNLPAQPMAELAQAAGTLRMTSPVGSLTLDGTALAAAADGAEELVLSVVPAGTETLNQAQQSAIQGQPVFDVTVLADGAPVSMPGGKLTVTVPYALAEGREPGGVVVSYLDEQGQLADCPTAYDAAAETVTFTPAHLSLYVVRYDALRLWTNPFTDVSEDDWYYDAVRYVNAGDLMTGTSSAAFAPGVTTSRAMLATLLYRLDGAPDLSGENLGYPYADVEADSWYGDGVYWARLHGVVTGVTGEIFDPDGDITREQMAVMLYRYAQYKDYDVTGNADLSGYADADSVSSWAQYAVAWAVDAGLISGVGNNTLNPQGSATRAEIATILMRFAETFVPAE